MGIFNRLFRPGHSSPQSETRASGSGFTAELIAARESWISGRRGIGELTATAQACVSLWEGGLSLADVTGTDALTPAMLGVLARSMALRGEAVFLIGDDRLIPACEWDVGTRNGDPTGYRLTVSEAYGSVVRTVLAAEVLHVRIGVDPTAPWRGTAPLCRASLTAGLLNAVESALAETFENAPLGSLIVPFPESPEVDTEKLSRGFRGRRGSVLLRESVNVTAAGGPTPAQDWKPHDLTPDLSNAMTKETLSASREAICAAFGVLPGMMNPAVTGPMVREAQRHLASWTLQPIASLIAREASIKLDQEITLDMVRPLQAFDAGGRARAFSTIVGALAQAKEAGLDPGDLAGALRLVDWEGGS